MPEWLKALRRYCDAGRASVLVSVVDAQGSTPRAAGARMVVTPAGQDDTIGGGHLEWRAIEIARAMLAPADAATTTQTSMAAPILQRFPLGPSLGQCCGGAVRLLFEAIDADAGAAAMIAALTSAWEQGRDVWRVLPLESGGNARVLDALDALNLSHARCRTHVAQNAAGLSCLYDYCQAARPQVILFGAGHVGRAVAALLGGLRCRLLWVDQREDFFPAELPPNVDIEIAEHPEDIVGQAAAGSYYLVMTHSHAVDQLLSERILRRGDAAWFGLIGSETKRRLFLKRLEFRGMSERQLAGLTCPIGIDGISSKEPASIAIAVATQLLLLWEQAATDR
ncbi:MAG TPA: xanthine dehydrogenase accessory protein XdhC [Herbaspirillum sp.]|jgi:xanthine dehydrogenase accessory factor